MLCSTEKLTRKTYQQRFWEKVQKTGACWLWVGLVRKDGYGNFTTYSRKLKKQKHWLAHRYSYRKLIGKIPKGMTLDHLCRIRHCVNPNHLEPVTLKENILRGDTITAINARKTHCIHGHEFTEENTYIRKDGGRRCQICHRAGNKRYKLKIHLESRA